MDEFSESEENSDESSSEFKSKNKSVEGEISRLTDHLNRIEEDLERKREENERLRELLKEEIGNDDPLVFEVEKLARASEDSVETELEVNNKINRRRKKFSYIGNILLISFLSISYLILNPPDRSVVAEQEIPVLVLSISLMVIWWQIERLIIDYELDKKYDTIDSFISVIKQEQWAPWILRAVFGVLSLILFGYYWEKIRSILISFF
ncbi:hypothetical protein [Halorubrum sp. 2020YC2]|uniref:hypothetical protein n=1 Tax=Halorubrum sp. 2020YC2 TaxID=2836432 RepID=UPI001BEA1204|nr:hypothetical protein [Halorubrum sp. 2020YC2]QWC20725.1 hypothetical protein KI388_07365 [Halorubrum sp. 2020YC2]